MDNRKIGQYLLEKRKEDNKTQKEIAEYLGVTYQAVSRWENGDSIPDIETLVMIADMYHVSIDEIVQRKSPQNESDKTMTGILPLISIIFYVIAFIVFLTINALWYSEVALGLYAIISLGGLIPANVYYFFEYKKHSVNTTLYYLISYIPLILGIMIVFSIYQ